MRLLFPIAATCLLLGDGLLFGLWSNRWQDSSQLPRAVKSLEDLPLTIGAWRGQPLPALDERVCTIAGFAGHIHRRYENPSAGKSVTVLLACGAFGPISVHTPEVCFAGGGYIQGGATTTCNLDLPKSPAAHLWTAQFAKAAADGPVKLRVYWTWNARRAWQAPSNPRWEFAGEPVLYKLYVIQEVRGEENTSAEDQCQAFLRVLLPELDKDLAFKPSLTHSKD
jgi:Protein of unknown function (DUF3485)